MRLSRIPMSAGLILARVSGCDGMALARILPGQNKPGDKKSRQITSWSEFYSQ